MNILRQNKEIHSIISIPNFLSDSEINQIFDLSREEKFVDATIGSKLNEEENHNLLTDHKIIHHKLKDFILNILIVEIDLEWKIL